MGKQLNYWMDYENFLLLAEKALSLGCVILREDARGGRVTRGRETDIITPKEPGHPVRYYFHLPAAGEARVLDVDGKQRLDYGYTASGNALIEADFSFVDQAARELRRARLFCISGYYDETGEYVPRPDCLTKAYQALARYAKKLAPYTELTETRVSTREENYLEKIEYRRKEYVTKACLDMVNLEGYKLR